jgi:Pentapeptide repeats (9 copies)
MKFVIYLVIILTFIKTATCQSIQQNKWIDKKITFPICGGINYICTDETVKNLGFGISEKSIAGNRIIFKEGVYFKNSQFLKIADFEDCEFSQEAYFFQSKFLEHAYFGHVNFLDEVSFSEATFFDNEDGESFSNETVFYNSEFKKKAYFERTEFLKTVNFNRSSFWKEVNFDGATFSQNVYFQGANFNKKAIFSQATFLKEVNFINANLPDTLDFRNAKFTQIVRLDLTKLDSLKKRTKNKNIRCKLFLNIETDITKLFIDARKFEICFDKTTLFDEKVAVYQQLLKANKDFGFLDNFQEFDIELQKLQINHSWTTIGPCLIWLSEYWWNFGYNKNKIYRNTLIAFGISAVLFFLFFPYFIKVYHPTQLNLKELNILNLKLNERFKTALFYTSMIFFSLKMEHSEINYNKYPWGTLFIYLIFSIGVIHLAYLAGAILNK